ncbi:MAG TPA: NAD(P)-dependent alcohol dehydrogenase [Gaiellaceae bacterium]|nr:NAD(P)-dependent alcohol dehydrogenase [Gaiellaceae bacterium]
MEQSMKAIVRDTYGSVDALRLADVDMPVASESEVLVRVRAAGVDQGVWHLMAGMPYVMRLAGFGLRAPKNALLGYDVAGQVEAIGAEVSAFRPGDEVFGTCGGSFAEYATARPDRLAAKPSNCSFEQAAATPVSGYAALQAVRDHGKVKSGQRVLIIGAGGGVGTFAVQIAKAYGAEVTGVCSTAKIDLVYSIGADHVIDYTRDDPIDGRERYDVILDIAGNRPLSKLRRALTPRGTLVIVGAEDAGNWLGVRRSLRAAALSPFLHQNLVTYISKQREQDLQELRALLESGTITAVVDRTFPLNEVPEAIRYLRDGRPGGKIVITI